MRLIGRTTVMAVSTALLLGTTGVLSAHATFPGDSWSIAFVRGNNIWVGDVGSGQGRRLTSFDKTGAHNPSWSADGKKIVFDRGGFIWTMNANGSGQRRITPGVGATWSPRGDRIAYVLPRGRHRVCGGYHYTAYDIVVRSTAANAKPVTLHSVPTHANICYDAYVNSRAVWSPDGTTVAFTIQNITNGGSADSELFEVSVNKHVLRTVTFAECEGGCDAGEPLADPNYSPDSTMFILTCGISLCVAPRAGALSPVSVGGDTQVSHPVWSPDGYRYAYAVKVGATTNIRVRVTQQSSVEEEIKNASQPDWSPVQQPS